MKTAESIRRESETAMRMGVNIARVESLKESEKMFLEVMPKVHNAFYHYIDTGHNTLSSLTVTNDDIRRVENLLIPPEATFMYNMIEHLFSYNYCVDEEIQKRVEDLFEFIKGFELVGYGVYVKLQDEWIYIVNTSKGKTYKKKDKDLKYISINKDYMYITGVKNNGEIVILTDAYMDISEKEGWIETGVKLEKGYVRIQHKNMYFREHLIMIAIVYGIEVAKHLVGRNSFLTIDHIDECENNNSISNLRVVTRESNSELRRNNYCDAYNFLDMYKKMQNKYKKFYLI